MPALDSLKIVIVGGGTAGWMTAAALARFLGTGYTIQLVESEEIGTVGVGEATIPQIHLFNAALDLDEDAFLRATQGTFKLGIEFAGWSAPGESYMHAFGAVGQGLGLLPFQHYWLRARQLGFAKDLSRYSLNELAARTMRMQRGRANSALPEMPYAYHFDAGLYATYLRRYSETRGIVRTEGRVVSATQNSESGDITDVVLDDGRRIAGDFFIDCSGFRGLLIEQTLQTGYEEWTHWLPCDRAMAVPCEVGGDFTPFTRSTARDAGWQWRIPLQHRIGNGYVYSSAHVSDDEAADSLLANLDGAPLAEPRPLRFTTGRRRKVWSHNCVAIGLSSGFMEPLESTSIHLIQSAVSRLLSVIPGKTIAPAIIDEFNRRADFEVERIRDFLVLHYHANARIGLPLWDQCRTMTLPDTLAAKIEMFRASGYIFREHEELFTEVGWFQVMVGQGIIPESYNRIADALPEAVLRDMLEGLEIANVSAARQMPRHIDFIAQHCSAQKEDA